MRALVTGSNGFLGKWLVRRLCAQGHFVRALVRKARENRDVFPPEVEIFEGDVESLPRLQQATGDVTAVFHLAGIRRAPDREAFFRVNTEGTRLLCESMAQSQTAKRLVLCGSLAASGPSSPQRPRLEGDALSPTEWYGESKARAEETALGYQGRLQVSVIRPARILGPGDRENLVFFKLVKQGWCLKLAQGPRPLSLVDVHDVVELMVLLAEHPRAVGEAFFCAADGTSSLEALQATVADALGVHCKTLWVPPWALQGLALLADVVSQRLKHPLPLNRKLARQLLAPAWTCSNEKAKRLLGFTPKRSIEDSIRDSAAWYQANGFLP